MILYLCLDSLVCAQKNSLPAGLTEDSSLQEILDWLDEAILAEARIGLESNASGLEPDEIPTSGTTYYERAIFSKGFRLADRDGCNLTLRNDDVELNLFETKFPDPARGSLDEFRKIESDQTEFTGKFFIPLKLLKAKRPPYQNTKKAKRAALLGTWRTEFKLKFDSVPFPTRAKVKELLNEQLKIEISGGLLNGPDRMTGDELAFTFDEKQMSEEFYAAFGRAIALCRDN